MKSQCCPGDLYAKWRNAKAMSAQTQRCKLNQYIVASYCNPIYSTLLIYNAQIQKHEVQHQATIAKFFYDL